MQPPKVLRQPPRVPRPKSQEAKKPRRFSGSKPGKPQKPRSQEAKKLPKSFPKGCSMDFQTIFERKRISMIDPKISMIQHCFSMIVFFHFLVKNPVFTVKSRISMIIFTFFFNDYFNDYFLLFLGFRGRNFNFFQNIDAFFKKRWSSARSGHEGISGAVVRALGALRCARGAWAEAFCSWTSRRL